MSSYIDQQTPITTTTTTTPSLPPKTTSPTDQDVYLQYKEALNDLNQNSKPIIIALTMLADDYKYKSRMVVKALDEYINKVTPELKLLGLYLMDSIIKNLKNTNYLELFQDIIVRLFTHVFLTNEEINRKSMYKLRQTWIGFFIQSVLYSIDKSINNIDPAWPITANVIQVAVPKLNDQLEKELAITKQQSQQVAPKSILKESDQMTITQQIQKQKEMLRLRQQEREKGLKSPSKVVTTLNGELGSSSNKQEQILKRIKTKLAETTTQNAKQYQFKLQQQRSQQQQDQQQQSAPKPSLKSAVSPAKTQTNHGQIVTKSYLMTNTTIVDEKKQLKKQPTDQLASKQQQLQQQQVPKQQSHTFNSKLKQKLNSSEANLREKVRLLNKVKLIEENSINKRDPRISKVSSVVSHHNQAVQSQQDHMQINEFLNRNNETTRVTIKRTSSQLTQQNDSNTSQVKHEINAESDEIAIKKTKLNHDQQENDLIFGQEDIDLRLDDSHVPLSNVEVSSIEQEQEQQPLVDKITHDSSTTQPSLDLFKVLQGLLDTTSTSTTPTNTSSDQPLISQQPNISLLNNLLFQQQQQQQQQHQPQLQEEHDTKDILDRECDLNELPAIKLKDITQIKQEQEDSLLLIDGRSYRIRPNELHKIKLYYNDYEFYCSTLTREILINNKCVYKMGELTKDVQLRDGRRVRLMYMGKRIELWFNSQAYQFRMDSPPKLIQLPQSSQKYYVKIDGRSKQMYFNDVQVCSIEQGLMNPLEAKEYIRIDGLEYELTFICPPKYIMIDDKMRIMRYDLPIPCVQIDSDLYVIKFISRIPRKLYIDKELFIIPFGAKNNRIKLNNRAHEITWGGPGFELIVDGKPYELQFNTSHSPSDQEFSREVYLGGRSHIFRIYGDIPDVRICGKLPQSILSDYEKQQELLRAQQQQQQKQPSAINVQDLVGKLFQHGLMPKSTSDQPMVCQPKAEIPSLMQLKLLEPPLLKQQPVIDQPPTVMDTVPDLTNLDVNMLKQKYDRVIFDLYSGLSCSLCGMRFKHENASKYSQHFDWHYRQNKREKEEFNLPHTRAYYYDLHEWLQYEELSQELIQQQEEEERAESAANEQAHKNNNEDQSDLFNDTLTPNTCAVSEEIDDKCCICNDPFESFWDTHKEEWRYRDAVKIDSHVYHPVCYEDAKQHDPCSIPTTPFQSQNHKHVFEASENDVKKELLFDNENEVLQE